MCRELYNDELNAKLNGLHKDLPSVLTSALNCDNVNITLPAMSVLQLYKLGCDDGESLRHLQPQIF